jgi:DNA-binding MarR family transcriptional regulator
MAAMHNVQQDVREQDNDPRRVLFQTVLKNLRIIFRSVQTYSRWVEKESGVSAAQLWMLWELYNEPGLTVSRLANVLSIHQSTCSNMLDKLQQKGLICRDRNSSDQRVVRLFLTESGAALLKKAPRPAQGALADVLLRLPDNALADLDSGLVQLVAALQVKDKEAGMIPIDGAE